jgi:hypothetical protein
MRPILPLLLMTSLLAACASGPVVHTERDPSAAFGSYHAYAWRQEPPISNPMLRQRIVDAIDGELAGKGWQRVPEPQADVVLVGNVSARDEQTVDAFYEGTDWSGWGWSRQMYPLGLRHVEVRTYKIGTLVLDMFDARTRRAVWRAEAEGTVPSSPLRRDEAAMKAVHAMFADFPPPGATTSR